CTGAFLSARLRGGGAPLRLGSPVVKAAPMDRGLALILADGTSLEGDRILLATGRRPRLAGLGLDKLGITPSAAGALPVDATCRVQMANGQPTATATVQPTATATAGPTAPAASAVQPAAVSTQPGALPRRPTAAPGQPTAAPGQPPAASAQPAGAPAQPTTGTEQPNAAPGQPTAAPRRPAAAATAQAATATGAFPD